MKCHHRNFASDEIYNKKTDKKYRFRPMVNRRRAFMLMPCWLRYFYAKKNMDEGKEPY